MVSRRQVLAGSLTAASAVALAACSPSGSGSGSSGSDGGDALTLRIWDASVKEAYEESLAAFTAASGVDVTVDVVPWDSYWDKLPLDIASGDAADVFWLNSASFTQFQQAGNLVNITEELGADAQGSWEKAVVDLYTRDGSLWGIPQIWDSIALFYNKNLTDAAGVDPTSLAFDPAASTDTLRDAAAALTTDAEGRHPGDEGFDAASRTVFGFNSQADRQAIIGPFLASNGAQWQGTNDTYDFASEQGIAAFAYLAALVNDQQVAPSAADTNTNGDFSRDLFIRGSLGLFQSGPYNLKNVADGVADSFEWGIAPMVAGRAGAKSLVHGVVAAGNAKSAKPKEQKQLLEWLGSKDGQLPLATQGIAFPGHTDAQQEFVDYWSAKGVDVQQFITAAEDPAPADTGAKALAGLTAVMPIFQEIFAGNISAEEGVRKAQEEGNAAMA
ncbi:MAG: sugar ABC transporter substrate-binding protein [Dermabacter sp.]|nr:sugar ABC transporter substrate-binding protein [Dermabacter sp.]